MCEPGSPVDCNDGISCTDDQCNEMTDSCENLPDDALCDNGLFCDGIETCDVVLDCQAGTPLDCSDFDDQCNVGICDEVNDQCVANPDPYEGQPCDDGDPYTIGDTCSAGVCIGESVQCVSDSDCDDGQYCNGAEVCVAGVCEPGSPVDCNDGISCTVDQCNEMTDSCENQPDDTRCDNGQFCDGVETCDALLDCQAGLPPATDDGVGCTIDSCNEATDSIEHIPDDNFCDNGLYCDGIETCDVVLDCQMGTPPCGDLPCDEETDQCGECTEDWQCDNGVFCDGAEICVDYHCMAGTPIDCDDAVGCTVDTCNELTDSCDNRPDDTWCDNGLFCDGIETCDVLLDCQPGAPVDCSYLDDQCNVGICVEVSDQCVANPDPYEGEPCDDGNVCTTGDICSAGACTAGTPLDCNDAEVCTDDYCDPSSGCVFMNNNAPCDDGLYCTTNDVCMEGICTSGVPRDCSVYDDQCNVGVCDEVSDQCVASPKVDGTSCDDGQFCTTNNICMAGICGFGTPIDCSYLDDQCNVGICDEVSDQCVADPNPKEGISCNDGDVCTIGDTCQLGVCSGILDETDSDNDGILDCTDPCPNDPNNDADNDGVCGDVDNCPNFTNPDQTDTDADGVGNACDNCPSDFNPDQVDSDGDGIGDVCENAPPIADAGGPYSGDEGTIITFNASSSSDPDGDELYYRWDLDNDGIWDTDYSSESTIMYVWYDDYTGTIVLEVSDGEKTNTTSTTISISNVGPEAFIDLILPEFFVLPGDTIIFIGSFTDPGTLDTHTIVWDFNDGSIILDNLELTHVYLQPGIYNVLLTITDDDGGIGTKNVIVEVVSLQEALEAIKEIINSFEMCYKLKKILKIHLELAIKFLNKADQFRTNGKEKLALIMQWVAKLQLRIFQKMIYVFERKEWITIDIADLLIAMTNRIIPKISF